MNPAGTHDRIEVSCWRDAVVERVGFDACGDYVELFWLPIIGPTSTWLLRRLAITAVLHPQGMSIDATTLAQSLGLGYDTSSRGSLARSLHRLTIFGLARVHGPRVEIRSVVPPLTLKHLARLPEHLQRAHSLWSENDPSSALEVAYSPSSESTTSSTNEQVLDSVVSASVW